MIKYRRIFKLDEIKQFSKKLLKHEELPPYLLMEEEYNRIVIGMEEEGTPIGLAYGVLQKNSEAFFFHFLFVKREYRATLNVLQLLEEAFKEAIKCGGIKEVIWKYTSESLEKDKLDSRVKLIAHLPFCKVRDIQRSRLYRVETKDIDYIRQFKIFNPLLWREKGHKVLVWENCDENLKNKIRQKEQSMTEVMDYLSPFSEEGNDGQEYDVHHSHVLVKDGGNEPMGWIMCSSSSNDEITIRNFFMYPEIRGFIIAHSFVTYILDVISERYKYLSFYIVDGNRQMEMIAKKYFVPILERTGVQGDIRMDIVNELLVSRFRETL